MYVMCGTSNRQQVSIICLYDNDKTGVARGGVCSLAQKTVLSSRDPQQILTVCISVCVCVCIDASTSVFRGIV